MLLLNFTWWANKKDKEGRNLFQGGFLGLDNIGVFDRDLTLPWGAYLSQSDGTAWMAMYSLNLLRIALEIAQRDPGFEVIATKFFEHFLYIARAMTAMGQKAVGLWDEQDGFYYDVLNLADGRATPLRVRSMVGLIPLFAVETLEPELLTKVPNFRRRMEWFLEHRPDLSNLVSRWTVPGSSERRLLSLLRGHRMKALLKRMLDPAEFLSDYGVRAIFPISPGEPVYSSVSGSRQSAERGLRAGGIAFEAVRRKLELARAYLVSDELPNHRVVAKVSPLLRRRFQSRVSNGVGTISHTRASRSGALTAPGQHFSEE